MFLGALAELTDGYEELQKLPEKLHLEKVEVKITEVEKAGIACGYLRIDRPQKFSNVVPALYGFVPQTYCGKKVGEYCSEKTGKEGIIGDGDPIDICVLTEKVISHGDLLVNAIPIGGFRMIDGNEADDKIIAVLRNDTVYGHFRDITEVPEVVIQRLEHYFLTYKDMPGVESNTEIATTYGVKEAHEVITRSVEDYNEKFANLGKLLS